LILLTIIDSLILPKKMFKSILNTLLHPSTNHTTIEVPNEDFPNNVTPSRPSSISPFTATYGHTISSISRAYRKAMLQRDLFNIPSNEEKETSAHQKSKQSPSPIFELSESNLADFQTRLVYLNHAIHCEESNATPSRPCRLTPKCGEYVTLLQHVYSCTNAFNCTVADCMTTSCILAHHRSCAMESCRLCKPVNDTKKRKQLRQDGIICMSGRGKKSRLNIDKANNDLANSELANMSVAKSRDIYPMSKLL
jgi:hypothetical protein